MTTSNLDAMAERMFRAALAEHRCGALLECLFAGGSATVDPNGRLVLLPSSTIEGIGEAEGRDLG
jgi:hypothetical protein